VADSDIRSATEALRLVEWAARFCGPGPFQLILTNQRKSASTPMLCKTEVEYVAWLGWNGTSVHSRHPDSQNQDKSPGDGGP
jgi:hypothetical protein